MNAPADPSFYVEGAKRMVAEGLESVSKIMAFMKENQSAVNEMDASERKQFVLQYEPAQMFAQVHPIVFHYIAVEGVFNAKAFRRYVTSVFGKPRNEKDLERAREDRKFVYHYKNTQHALYYKYLLFETNPNAKISDVQHMYDEVVKEMNADTDKMLDAYEKAQEDAKLVEEQLTEEKRQDLVRLLKKRIDDN